MISNEFIQSLSQRAAKIFPAAKSLQTEIETNLYDLLSASFSKLNLVSREEFDSQLAVLQRAQETIDKLEKKVIELQTHLQSQN